MFVFHRFTRIHAGPRAGRGRTGGRIARHQSLRGRFKRIRAVVPVVCGIGIAAVAGWLLAGGGLPSAQLLFGQPESSTLESSSGGAPVHIATTPSGAQARIDGAGYGMGKTPLDLRLSPGQHSVSLEHPDALEDERALSVTDTGATVDVALWRRHPDVVALRPVYPGAALVDSYFLEDGQVALLVGLPGQGGGLSPSRELWLFGPATGRLVRVTVPGVEAPVSTMILTPDGSQVAFVKPGSVSAVTASLWPVSGSRSAGTQQASQPEAVWVAPLDGSPPPHRIFELPSTTGPIPSTDPERIVDIASTPDGLRLIAITRQSGPPARSRIFLLNVPLRGGADMEQGPTELVLLPAEVLPGSALPDPGGRWLALVTHAAVAPGGNDVLNLCILELRPGGVFRDLADLGSAAGASSAAAIAWPPLPDEAPGRLAFVGPAPAPAPSGGGLFDFFGVFNTLRTSSASPSGLFMAAVETSGLETVQPRRVGTTINTLGPVWRSENTLYSFARQDDGTLALRSIDPTTGAVRDLGVRLPAGTGQGKRLAARWDVRHGYALLLAPPSNSGTSGPSLQAWLVSFVSTSSAVSAPR